MTYSLLPLLALLGIASPQRHYYDTPALLADTTVCLPVNDLLRAEARMTMRDTGSDNRWGMSLISTAGDTVSVAMDQCTTGYGDDIVDRVYMRLTVTCNGEILLSGEVRECSVTKGAYNTLSLSMPPDGRSLAVSSGARSLAWVGDVSLPHTMDIRQVCVSAKGRGSLSAFCVESGADPEDILTYGHDLAEVERIVAAASADDPAIGFWNYFDRKNDPVYARPGGRYRLAIVPSVEVAGAYDILYIGGAEIHADRWDGICPKLKGRLVPAEFAGHYNLEWVDAEFRTMDRDIHATLDTAGSLLTLSFPSLHTVMRFAKEQNVD